MDTGARANRRSATLNRNLRHAWPSRTFALLRERAVPQVQAARAGGLRASLARIAATWHQARRYRDFSWLLACSACYQAGIAVVIALAAVYAEQVLGFKQTDTMTLIFLVNIAAALGNPPGSQRTSLMAGVASTARRTGSVGGPPSSTFTTFPSSRARSWRGVPSSSSSP